MVSEPQFGQITPSLTYANLMYPRLQIIGGTQRLFSRNLELKKKWCRWCVGSYRFFRCSVGRRRLLGRGREAGRVRRGSSTPRRWAGPTVDRSSMSTDQDKSDRSTTFQSKNQNKKNHKNTTKMFIFLFTLPFLMLIHFLNKKI